MELAPALRKPGDDVLGGGPNPGFVDLNKETVVARSREDKARVSDSSLKGLGVDTCNAEGKNICAVGDASNFEAGQSEGRR